MEEIKISPLSTKVLLSDGRYCALLEAPTNDIYKVQFSDLHTEEINKNQISRRATRFEQEYFGLLGDYWKLQAEESIKKSMKDAESNAEVDKDGAISWKSNGQYLMDDICEILEFGGYQFSREETKRKREEQVEYQIRMYREGQNKNKRTYSKEIIKELESSFEKGTKVVDILTGESIIV